MNKKAQGSLALSETVVGFGFLEGIWLAVGINPESIMIDALIEMAKSLGTGAGYIFIMTILPILAFALTVWGIYSAGGGLGIIALVCAFLSGLLILVSPVLTAIFLVVAVILGVFLD